MHGKTLNARLVIKNTEYSIIDIFILFIYYIDVVEDNLLMFDQPIKIVMQQKDFAQIIIRPAVTL